MSTDPVAAKQKRIGVFGGAFDPPHQAHLTLAKTAVATLELDELRVIPTGHAWHKERALSGPEHRLAMTKLAFEGMPHVLVDDRELRRPGPTFTIDTLEALQAENPLAQLYLIMGADQFAVFRQWQRWKAILEIAIICIADRATPVGAAANFGADFGFENRFVRLSTPLMPVSATALRLALARAAPDTSETASLVSDPVARYISLNRLYRPQ